MELTLHALRRHKLTNEIQIVGDGVEALDYLFQRGAFADRAQVSPKVILLDLKLPRLDGLEVLKRVRADETTRNIPVVILTSSREEPDLARAYELGANSYIVKPVDWTQFSEAIRQVGMYWLLLNQPPPKSAAAQAIAANGEGAPQ